VDPLVHVESETSRTAQRGSSETTTFFSFFSSF